MLQTIRVDLLVPLMHQDLDEPWMTDHDPDHPKGTHPKVENGTKQTKNSDS